MLTQFPAFPKHPGCVPTSAWLIASSLALKPSLPGPPSETAWCLSVNDWLLPRPAKVLVHTYHCQGTVLLCSHEVRVCLSLVAGSREGQGWADSELSSEHPAQCLPHNEFSEWVLTEV